MSRSENRFRTIPRPQKYPILAQKKEKMNQNYITNQANLKTELVL